MDDIYYSVMKEASREIKVKGSKFIGYVNPVETIEQAERYIQLISSQNYTATHNCTAFKIGIGDDSIFRYNDDGEPAGTGGRPILEAIQGQGITDVVGVVTRYFGGTKLGTGGLSRAYRECIEQTIKKAGKKKLFLTDTIDFTFPYNQTGPVMELIEKYGCRIKQKKYGTDTKLSISIKQSLSAEFKQQLVDKTGDRIIFLEKR